MRDLIPMLALTVLLGVCLNARADRPCADNPDDVRCRFLACRVERDGARAELAAVEQERDQLRAENVQLRTSLVEQQEWIDRSRQVCNRKAGAAAMLGGAAGVGLTAGSVWLAGRPL